MEYDFDALNGKPSRAELGIVRKHSSDYSFVRNVRPVLSAQDKLWLHKQTLETPEQVKAYLDKRQAATRYRRESLDSKFDDGLRESKRVTKRGLALPSSRDGLGMAGMMRRVSQCARQAELPRGRDQALVRRDKLAAMYTAGVRLPGLMREMRTIVRVVKAKDREQVA